MTALRMPTASVLLAILLVAAMSVVPAHAAMVELADDDLGAVSGQAMFLADRIIAPGANGTPDDGNAFNNFTFYRVALDADLNMNMNINKLQLGCGGFNEGLVANSCDTDVDYLRFLGTTGPGSDFQLQRPYLELAIKNDNDKTRREVVGLKIGTALADGIMAIGRVYANGQVNQENGGTCNAAYSQAVDDGSRLACHSGANRMSGYMFAELSGYGAINSGFGNAQVCFGIINAPNGCNSGSAFFAAVTGTRMSEILLIDRNLVTTSCTGILAVIGCPDAVTDIRESLRFLHSIRLTDVGTAPRVSRDFFISFQRERVAYPIFDQASPYDTDGNGAGGQTYSATANTGWWMNIAYTSALNLNVGTMNLSGGDALSALNEGANVANVNMNQTPNDNCYGTATFC